MKLIRKWVEFDSQKANAYRLFTPVLTSESNLHLKTNQLTNFNVPRLSYFKDPGYISKVSILSLR